MQAQKLRHLILVLGDQLDRESLVFDDFDPEQDAIWMCEASAEATHVWSSKARIAIFIAAMRHFRDELRAKAYTVFYRELNKNAQSSLEAALSEDLRKLDPDKVIAVKPGEWRLSQSLPEVCKNAGVLWVERPDRHFYCDEHDFSEWAKGRKEYRLEFFYRWIRKRENILMEGDQPASGKWNFDHENRGVFDKRGPGFLPKPMAFEKDKTTLAVIELVEKTFSEHPGRLDTFDWPLTPVQAEVALDDFIEHRLPLFGQYQDAMWTDEPYLYHSRISAALNLKLLSPRKAVAAAVRAYETGKAPLAAVEGFIRQIIGWREFVRGMYWLRMPEFLEDNALDAQADLPDFYWTGDTDMACLRQAIGQTLEFGYAHHIHRLMVTGLFSQLLGVEPKQIHEWYLAVYVDAVEWVELPNVLGMSQYADNGKMTSKPYVASGAYIKRMSNYCQDCRYKPEQAVGNDACPFTTLYWDFLSRYEDKFARHPRTALQWKNLARIDAVKRSEISEQADGLRLKYSKPKALI
ncbi:MAG TPA: cryptochrome/photolyase family protein [Arenimonas sp.]|nr:cryptochrome/photolyase family protein [Arenimonas sp.]HPW32283.1 cryptochrome/photolyase family protein [Arenimonas sp.]